MLGLDGGAQLQVERQRAPAGAGVGAELRPGVFQGQAQGEIGGGVLVHGPGIGQQGHGAAARNARHGQLGREAERELTLGVSVRHADGVFVYPEGTQRVTRRVETLNVAVIEVADSRANAPVLFGVEHIRRRALPNVTGVSHVVQGQSIVHRGVEQRGVAEQHPGVVAAVRDVHAAQGRELGIGRQIEEREHRAPAQLGAGGCGGQQDEGQEKLLHKLKVRPDLRSFGA